MLRIDRDEARRIAVRAALLDTERPDDLVATITRLAALRVELTTIVAPAHDHVAWSRLGDAMLGSVREEARRRLRMVSDEGLRLELSALEDRAGLLGGMALPDRSPTPAVLPAAGDAAS